MVVSYLLLLISKLCKNCYSILDLELKEHRFIPISDIYLVRHITFLNFELYKCTKMKIIETTTQD